MSEKQKTTNSGRPDPSKRLPSDEVDLFIRKRKRRRRIGLVSLLCVALLAAAGYGLYGKAFRLSASLSKLAECDIGNEEGMRAGNLIPKACEKAAKEVLRRLPKECPKVLAAIKSRSSQTQKNRLLALLLHSRLQRFKLNTAHRLASLKADPCTLSAVKHVLSSRPIRTGKVVDGALGGLLPYNVLMLFESNNWRLAIEIVSKLPTSRLRQGAVADGLRAAAFDTTNVKDPEIYGPSRKLFRKFLFSKILAVYQEIVADSLNPKRKSAALLSKDGLPLSDFVVLLRMMCTLDKGVTEKLLNDRYLRMVLPTHRNSGVRSELDRLFRDRNRTPAFRQKVLSRMGQLRKRHLKQSLFDAASLLGYAALDTFRDRKQRYASMAEIKWLPAYFELILRHWNSEAGDLSLEILANGFARAPDRTLFVKVALLERLKLGSRLREALMRLRTQKQPVEELLRRLLIVSLAYDAPGKYWAENLKGMPGVKKLAWLNRYFDMSVAKDVKDPRFPNPGEWTAWAKKSNVPAVRLAFETRLPVIRKQLKSADLTLRLMALLALRNVPFETRLPHLKAALNDKVQAVRAAATLVLTRNVKAKANLEAAYAILQTLRQDPGWAVRIVAFGGLWKSGSAKQLGPWVNAKLPPIVQTWEASFKTTPTKKILPWLDRKDRGAGLVLMELGERLDPKHKQRWRPDWKRLGRLVTHKSEFVRFGLLTYFWNAGRHTLDWSPLFADASVVVVSRALFRWEAGSKDPKLKKYVPAVLKLLEHPNLSLRIAAMEALVAHKARAALPHLKKQTKHPVCMVAEKARLSIAAILGKSEPLKHCVVSSFSY